MFGLDDLIASQSAGATFLIVCLVAIALGLRHASDPDHLSAVTTLLAGDRAGGARRARRLGLAWGAGHATTLFAFGVPIVLSTSYLPQAVQAGAETAVGVTIVVLAARLLLRWRRGELAAGHAHAAGARTDRQAYGIGLLHGMGGSAGVGVLLLAHVPDHVEALVALALLAGFTALSMAAATTSFGFVLGRDAVAARFTALAPVLGATSLAFGAWYALGALQAVPHVL